MKIASYVVGVCVMVGVVSTPAAEKTVPATGADGTTHTSAKWEHFAFASDLDCLDGPRLEAMGTDKGRKASSDEDGNMYILWKYSSGSIRCARIDGRVETIAGDGLRWNPNMGIEEGPAAYMPSMRERPVAGDQSSLRVAIEVYGKPLEGEDKGTIYVYCEDRSPYRVFKNKEKNNRWWFRRLGTPGGPPPPPTVGQTAKLAETDLSRVRIGQGWITWKGYLYKFDEAAQTMTCVLTPADYEARCREALAKVENPNAKEVKIADRLILAEDGTMYIMHPWREGNVFSISVDRKEFEYIVRNNRNVRGWNIDGPGLYTTWHCGPSFITTSGNTLFLRAIDSPSIRRWKDGRVSVLCPDGEWRERAKDTDRRLTKTRTLVSGFRPADHGLPYINIHYTMGDLRVFRFGPLDFDKPTVGPPVREKGGSQ